MDTNEFGVSDLIYNADIYDRVNDFDFDLNFYKKLCNQAKGKVLELCCGTGRLTIPIRQSGVDIQGLDLSVKMLERAKIKASQNNLDIKFINRDMRNLELKEEYSLIFIPFNSLQNIYTHHDLENVFNGILKHLGDQGVFAFDIFNPSIHFMVEREKSLVELYRFKDNDGNEVVIREKVKYDSASQVNRAQWFIKIGDRDFVTQLDMRCFYPLEMDYILERSGFRVEHKYGDFDENPFCSESGKQIYVCRRYDNH